MDLTQAILLALLQGLTEFLPVSSSAHLILVPVLTDWPDQGLAFDVAVHFGTLLAVMMYFRHELLEMGRDWFRSVTGRGRSANSRLAWAVLFGTVPVGLAGLLLHDFIAGNLRSEAIIAWATIGFGVVLWWSEYSARHTRDEFSLRWSDIAIIGGAQALALIPGTSRSGITITAALALGLTRQAAARYSFLLSIPVILLAAGLETLNLLESQAVIDWSILGTGFVMSMVAAFMCIHVFLKLLDRIGLVPFVIYRFILGAMLLYLM